MARKKIAFGIGAGIVSLGADGLAGLLILRLLTYYLPPASAGFWVLVTSAGSFLLLLQCGMGPTIARVVAQSIVSGDQLAIKSTFGTMRIVFRRISAGVCIFAIILFAIYLWPAAQRGHVVFSTACSWFPYALGMVANINGQASLFVLNGYGEVGWDKVFRTFYSVFGIGSVWLALHLGLNLGSLAIIYLILNLLFWFAARQKLRTFLGGSFRTSSPQKGQISDFFYAGSKLLLLNVLTFLITQFTIFVVERQFGIELVTPYTAMLRIGTLIGSLGGLIPLMLYPYVASSWASRDYRKCRQYYLFGIATSVGISTILSLVIYLFARPIFLLWLGPGQYLGNEVFGTLLVFYLICVHHGAHATPALAVVGNAFAIPAVVNAALTLLLLFYLPKSLGLIGIPLSMLIGTVIPSAYVVYLAWNILMRKSTNDLGTRSIVDAG